jgi:uncharacterized protein
MPARSFLDPALARGAPKAYALLNDRTGRRLAISAELAIDSKSRNRGLLGRDGLDAGHALILAPCSSVHTFFMRFPIDVLFVARDGQILKIRTDMGPWRLAARFGSFAVVELQTGYLISHVR